MKLYQTAGAAYIAGARDIVPVVTHATARAAYRRAEAAAEAIPEAFNRKRHNARVEAIDAYLAPRKKYANAADVAQAIAGAQVHYIHRHSVNLGTRHYPDYRPEYEQTWDGIIKTGTASRTGKSVNSIAIAHLIFVRG